MSELVPDLYFENFDAEEYEYISIIASTVEEHTHGYHMPIEESKKLLEKENFKILIFNRDAKLVAEKNSLMSYA
ncbi:MAG: hypothetical protein P8X74_22910 [Reinekea sp.]